MNRKLTEREQELKDELGIEKQPVITSGKKTRSYTYGGIRALVLPTKQVKVTDVEISDDFTYVTFTVSVNGIAIDVAAWDDEGSS